MIPRIRFFTEYLKDIRGVGSVTSSSRFLVEKMIESIDEGADVFQTALLGQNGPRARMVGGGPDLDMTVPLKRTRLRATFIFARQRGTAGGGSEG